MKEVKFSQLVYITGKSGLYIVINAKQDGIIARSLENNNPVFFSHRKNPYSILENIEMYSNSSKKIYLKDLLLKMNTSAEVLPNIEDIAAMVAYFKIIEPNLNFNKIYPKDFKRTIQWFQIIKSQQISLETNEELPM